MNDSLTTTDPRTHAFKDLAAFCTGFIPSRIATDGDYEPTREEAHAVQDDLLLLARKVDRVLLAYGAMLLEQGIITAQDCKENFDDVLRTAIEGNATYIIEARVEERISERADV